MSREIKFRAWSITHECMVFSMTIANGTIKRKRDNLYLEVLGDTVGVKPETLGQFTGLKDKNGKEIYEGDLLKVNNYSYVSYEVIWGYSGFRIKASEQIQNEQMPNRTEIIVIGNIHENPELLK